MPVVRHHERLFLTDADGLVRLPGAGWAARWARRRLAAAPARATMTANLAFLRAA